MVTMGVGAPVAMIWLAPNSTTVPPLALATQRSPLASTARPDGALDKSVDDRSISSGIMAPPFEELHDDPRFARLKKRLGIGEI